MCHKHGLNFSGYLRIFRSIFVCVIILICLILQIEKLSDKQCQPESQLKFITEAWLQVNIKFLRIHI